MDDLIEIVHDSLPGQVGTCLPSALPVWEARGWKVKTPDTAATKATTAAKTTTTATKES